MATAINDYFAGKLCQRPDDLGERHARAATHGFTAHDLATVFSAAESLWEAHDEWVSVYAEWSEIIDTNVPATERSFPAWERYAAEPIQRLVAAHDRAYEVAPPMGGDVLGHGNQYTELFPISRWATKTKKYRRASRILVAAIKALKA